MDADTEYSPDRNQLQSYIVRLQTTLESEMMMTRKWGTEVLLKERTIQIGSTKGRVSARNWYSLYLAEHFIYSDCQTMENTLRSIFASIIGHIKNSI